MRNVIVGLAVVLVMSFVACGQKAKTETLQKNVCASVEEKLREAAKEAELNFEGVVQCRVVHKSGSSYEGLVEWKAGGESATNSFEVTVDGENFIWKMTR